MDGTRLVRQSFGRFARTERPKVFARFGHSRREQLEDDSSDWLVVDAKVHKTPRVRHPSFRTAGGREEKERDSELVSITTSTAEQL